MQLYKQEYTGTYSRRSVVLSAFYTQLVVTGVAGKRDLLLTSILMVCWVNFVGGFIRPDRHTLPSGLQSLNGSDQNGGCAKSFSSTPRNSSLALH